MKILVTGGAGFIGSHVADCFIKEGHDVVIVDSLIKGKRENINPKAKFYELDIRDDKIAEVFKKEQIEIVDHHAAQMDVRKSVENPIYDAQVNILGTLNLLENSVKYQVKKFIHISSGGAIYGEPSVLPIPEEHKVVPICHYGASKYAGERYLNPYFQTHGLKYTVLRYGNVYGPRQDPYGEAGVIAIFIGKMLKGERPTIFGDGEQLRDYVYVGDVVEANVLAASKGENEEYNVGTGVGTSVNELFSNLKELMKFDQEVVYAPPRTGELFKVYLNVTKIEREWGWKARVGIKEGLGKTIDFFRK
jgi:UDP-glucose 4-epimerase